MRRLFVTALACLACGFAAVAAADAPTPEAAYRKLAAEILQDFYERNPSWATALGLHEYDGRLEDASRAAVDDENRAIAKFGSALAAIDPKGLTQESRLDREMLLGSLEARRLRNEAVRGWAKIPTATRAASPARRSSSSAATTHPPPSA